MLFINAETTTVLVLVLAFRRIVKAYCMDTATSVENLDSCKACWFYRQRLRAACVDLIPAVVLRDLTFDISEPQITKNVIVGPLDTFE